jgi:membrane-bound metal-dependent hydrolase YbcI (DUF457 family)
VSGPAHHTTTIALAVGLAAATNATPEQAGPFILIAVLTSGGWLSPDCDLWLNGTVPIRLGRRVRIRLRIPIKHRHLTHWPPTAVAVAYLVYLGLRRAGAPPDVAEIVALGVLAGWASHLIEDSPTSDGIPLWPFTSHFHLLPFIGPFRFSVVSGKPNPDRKYVAINEWVVAAPSCLVGLYLLPGVMT